MNEHLTGFPSIDKPWLKYYSEDSISKELPQTTMYQYLYENNKEHQDNIALNYFGKKITYRTFFSMVDCVTKSFQNLGIKKGDIVTIMSMQTPETLYVIYSLNNIGAIANMIYMSLAEKEIVQNIQKTNSKAFFILENEASRVKTIIDQIPIPIFTLPVSYSMPWMKKVAYKISGKTDIVGENFFKFLARSKNEQEDKKFTYEKDLPAVMVYTSGTTGEPKGVILTNENLNAVAHQYRYSGMEFKRGDTFFNMLPPFMGFGVSVGMHLPLALGMESILWIIPEPKEVIKAFSKNIPNHFVSGPIIMQELVETLDQDLSKLITFAGGRVSFEKDQEKYINTYLKNHNSKAKCVTGYGMTELSATVCTGMNHVYKEGTLGIPMLSTDVKIVDSDTGMELPILKTGEICFSGPNLMMGYYQNEKATSEMLRKHDDGKIWLHTGDLGEIDEEGFVHFKGRLKRIYLTKSKVDGDMAKIFPQRVEELFDKHPLVKHCATIGVADEERLNVFVSFIELTNISTNKEQIEKELLSLAQSNMPEYSVPDKIIFIDKIPLTQSAKIDYRALEKGYICKKQ